MRFMVSFVRVFLLVCDFFFFKQKTAYEMRISDWSSDVCSSDLLSPSSLNATEEIQRFQLGLGDLRRRKGLYVEQPGTVEITDGVLDRARLPLPARVVVGTYTAETFLIQDGRVLAAAVREIEVHKSGFERFVAKAADEWSI